MNSKYEKKASETFDDWCQRLSKQVEVAKLTQEDLYGVFHELSVTSFIEGGKVEHEMSKKKQMLGMEMKVWKDAQGTDLPDIDREVIALQEVTEGSYKVCFAHRPDTTRCTTIPTPAGIIEDIPIATYGKGNWNIGEIKWWLDLPLPYEELEENEKPYEGIINELYKTYKKKNADYGNSFAETIQEFGFIPAVARINDKVKRIKNLVKGQKMNVNESLRDNLMDIANYCIMTIMSLDEEINKK